MAHEEEFTNSLGIPDVRIVRCARFEFSVTFPVVRTATMETNFRDDEGNLLVSYQKGETYTEDVTLVYQAKATADRIYLTRKGLKGRTIDCGYYNILTNKFMRAVEFAATAECSPMCAKFREITGYKKG